MFVSDKKMIISGDIVEVIEYEKPIVIGGESNNRNGRSGRVIDDRTEEEKEEDKINNRNKTLISAKSNLRRLINANAKELTKFLTLTFAENEKNLDYCNKQFHLFCKRMNYYMRKEFDLFFKYVMVVEFQKRGAVHYHLLCNLPYIQSKRLEKIWGNGFIKINKIDSVTNVGAYVTKYMQKDLNDERLVGRRCWNSSRNLNKPMQIVKEKEIKKIALSLSLDGIEPFEKSFFNDYLGKIVYKQYIINQKEKANSL